MKNVSAASGDVTRETLVASFLILVGQRPGFVRHRIRCYDDDEQSTDLELVSWLMRFGLVPQMTPFDCRRLTDCRHCWIDYFPHCRIDCHRYLIDCHHYLTECHRYPIDCHHYLTDCHHCRIDCHHQPIDCCHCHLLLGILDLFVQIKQKQQLS